eukprot:m.57213 g.57213  ORF g.57213 m.57213 type:complete len:291 (+) comp18851_c0_seq1:91-963(+)
MIASGLLPRMMLPASRAALAVTKRRAMSLDVSSFGGGVLIRTLGIFGTIWAYLAAKQNWDKKNFLRRVNLSLCHIKEEKPKRKTDPIKYQLAIRTMFEKEIGNIFLNNSTLVNIVEDAAHQTTEANPFLSLPEQDSWYTLATILNEISSEYSVGHLLEDIDPSSVVTESYCFGLTREAYKYPNQRFEKLRIMLIKEEWLQRWEKDIKQGMRICKATHADRWRTLDEMSRLYQAWTRAELAAGGALPTNTSHPLMRIQLSVPRGPATNSLTGSPPDSPSKVFEPNKNRTLS